MQHKTDRQKTILDLIHRYPIATHSELQARLRSAGIRVDQGTLSRDIRELSLVKVAAEGGYRYALLEEANPTLPQRGIAVIKRFMRSIECSGNQIVIKTDAGAAQPVAEAIDRLNLEELLGTVAGDNTIIAVVKEGLVSRRVVNKLEKIFD